MILTSFSVTLQEAVSDPDQKHLQGNIKDFKQLLQPETLAHLEEALPGPYAFLAFHPAGDKAVMSYIRQDTLGDDTGPDILCLFTLQVDAREPISLQGNDWDKIIELRGESNPSGSMLRILFAPDAPPVMPGLVLFRSFLREEPVVYASLADCPDASSVQQRIRTLFNLAATAGKQARVDKPNSFADKVAAQLQHNKFPYTRTGSKSMKEWFIKAYQVAWDLRSDILTVAGLFV